MAHTQAPEVHGLFCRTDVVEAPSGRGFIVGALIFYIYQTMIIVPKILLFFYMLLTEFSFKGNSVNTFIPSDSGSTRGTVHRTRNYDHSHRGIRYHRTGYPHFPCPTS